ncbi:S-adenosyl-L-methionine-dependent methyltransferase [Jimgerdemannia flammicorona]|uniref:S-adenosyl-L-methionine-dependent methyltransferase n=1 Tax=Jimgerdemannia flammicorona TaxID=994334 RepID=A0A433QC16_9FUNG|nr:S-adenosyl-L-methionine-dependent methyltransferase [Jimgerdemannia flammicorona]
MSIHKERFNESLKEVNSPSSQTSSGTTSDLPDNYKIINGSDRDYVIPGDSEEITRMEMFHYTYRYLFHGNFNAPVEDMLDQGGIILDVGCGGGPWTMEMAKSYPKSSFVGIDKEDCFPASEIPRNCIFQIADLLKGLPFKDNTFDYVYSRGMFSYFSIVEWQQVVEELRRVTKPGGYVELVEFRPLLNRLGPYSSKLQNAFVTFIQARGGDVHNIPEKLGDYLAGFDDLTTDYVSTPIGWRGRIGHLNLQNMEFTYMALKLPLCKFMGWTEEEYDVIKQNALTEPSEHKTWGNIFYAFGMKPLD